MHPILPPSPPAARRVRPVLAVTLALCLAPAFARAEEVRLTVFHTTDLHGALTAYDYRNDTGAPRGLVKIATMVKRARAENPNVLLLDAGDCITGGAIETAWRQGDRSRPEPMMTAMSVMGYDAFAVGNHEFDVGLEALEQTRLAARFPWLAANVRRVADGAPAFDASFVKNVGGVRVGVVGLCTPAVPSWVDSSNWQGLAFESPVTAAQREVRWLREHERCDVVLLVAHSGLERDPATGRERRGDTPGENWGYRLATEVSGVDAVIIGHTHVTVPSVEIQGQLVTQAGKFAEHLGRLDLTVARAGPQAAWKVSARQARVIAVTDSIPADPELAAFAAPYHDAAQRMLNQVVGESVAELASPRGRLADGPLWELVHRAQLAVSGADVSLATLFDPTARIARGPVTVRDLARVYTYENTLGVVEMTGAELEETLEESARYFAPYTYARGASLVSGDVHGFNFDTAEGVDYEIDLTRPVGDRVIHLTRNGAPLSPSQVLRVVTNNYRMNGGGGYAALARAKRVSRLGDAREALVAYLRTTRPLDGSFTPNWTLLPDYAPTPERPLIDLLVRQGVAPRGEVHRMFPDEPARRGDLAYWLARSFGWREKRLSGAFADVPDSLEPWLDGLLKRNVLGNAATEQLIKPFSIASLVTALDWCEAAARHEHYALASRLGDPSFRRSLTAGVSLDGDGGFAYRDTLTRSEVLGIVANTRFPTVRVLETTDFHGAIQPRARRQGRALGGSPIFAAHVERLRAENPEGTILIDGGDCFQGTMISNLAFGRPVVEQMNHMRYAAVAIGNHEFDWTVDTLAQRTHEMKFAALGANLTERRNGRRPKWARSDTTVTRRGVRVSVLGLCYPFTPSVTLPTHVAHLAFTDDSATAAKLAPRLRKAGADLVLGVGHIPASRDSAGHVRGDLARLARGVPAVDAWFGGHSHNEVLDTIDGRTLLIAGARGEAVGVCDIVMDPIRGHVVEQSARLVNTWADEVTPDSAVTAMVARWDAGVSQLAGETVGQNARRLTRGRAVESTVGNFVADAIREFVKADIALQNSGGLRADLPEGPVTKGSIYEVMPFDNTIVTVPLTGAELKRLLEEALAGGRTLQVSGMRYRFDADRPALQRLIEVLDAHGRPIDDATSYTVAVNNFMAAGGDDLDVLGASANKRDTNLLVRDAMETFVRARTVRGEPIDYRVEGRIERNGSAASDD